MATDPKDLRQANTEKASSQSQNPSAQTPRPAPLDRADLVSSQTDANQRFRRNSEQMQARAKVVHADQRQPAPASKGDGLAANQDRGATTPSSRNAGDNRDPLREHSDRKLQFAKDHERGARTDLKAESAKQPGKELTFVKDQGQDINRGR